MMRRSALHRRLLAYLASAALLTPLPGRAAARQHDAAENDPKTATPIKHVVVIYGENRSFDHLFATYVPGTGRDGPEPPVGGDRHQGRACPARTSPKARQYQASDTKRYRSQPAADRAPPSPAAARHQLHVASGERHLPPPFKTGGGGQVDYDSAVRRSGLLTTGASGLPPLSIDTRIDNVRHLPPGPFQLTPRHAVRRLRGQPGAPLLPDVAAGRLQRRRQRPTKPERLPARPFPWVEVTVGAGATASRSPPGFNDETTGEGSTAMGFYNVPAGRRALLQASRRQVRDERQLPPAGHGRHRARTASSPASPTPSGTATARAHAARPAAATRSKTRSAAGHQQLVHAGRLRGRAARRRQLQQLRGSQPAGRRPVLAYLA